MVCKKYTTDCGQVVVTNFSYAKEAHPLGTRPCPLGRVSRWILDNLGSCKSWKILKYFWHFYIFNVVVIGVWSVHNGIFLLGKRAKSGHVTPSFETWLLAFLFPPTILAIPPILPHCTLLWLPEEPSLQIALCQQITAKYDIFRAAAEIFSRLVLSGIIHATSGPLLIRSNRMLRSENEQEEIRLIWPL